jgi:hypothetical protein
MAIRRTAPLALDMIDYLLGTRRTPQEIAEFERQGIPYDAFLEFDDIPEVEVDRLWATHRDILLAEARRRGVDVPRGSIEGQTNENQ